jgi:predicted small metal-binding protein
MARYYIDCRNHSGADSKCTLALVADKKEELLEAAVQHAASVHGYKDTPEFRKEIVKEFKEGTPPL